MPGPTLELNVSVGGLTEVRNLDTALTNLTTKVEALGGLKTSAGLADELKVMATESKYALTEMQQTLSAGLAGLESQLEKFSTGQGRRNSGALDETKKFVDAQRRVLQAGYEKQLEDGERFNDAQLRAMRSAGIQLSAGHKLTLATGVSGAADTGASFSEAGGSAAAEVLASQKASATTPPRFQSI